MKIHRLLSLAGAAALMLASAPIAPAAETRKSTKAEKGGSFAGHLELGTRITHFILDKEDENTFIGTINHLGDDQDYAPYKLFADWMISPRWGIELTWDRVAAIARTKAEDHHTDGRFELDGPILTVFGRYPNKTIFRPYAGIGAAFYGTDFEPEHWWAHGFDTPEDYDALGRPPGNHNNKSRSIVTDDTVGFVATAGTDIKISKHWYADLYVRYTAVELDAHIELLTRDRVISEKETESIPFDNLAAGAGLKYVF